MKLNRFAKTLTILLTLLATLCATTSGAVAEQSALTVTGSLELKYASGFSVDYCEGGYKIITDGVGKEFLWVPEGAEVPETDMIVLQAPLTELGCFATTHAVPLKALGKLDLVTMVTTKRDSWHMPQIQEQMDAGKTTYVGKTKEPDFELISAIHPQLTFVTANTSAASDEVLMKFDELGIEWMAYLGNEENHPLGRIEWVKLVGALLDMEDEAEAFFNETEARVEAVVAKVGDCEDKPTINQTFVFDGVVYVRNDDDYVNKMLSMAGGANIFEGLAPEQTGNTKVTIEEFYAQTENLDVLIYDTTSDVNVKTVSDIVAYGEYLSNMKAIQDGNVWGIAANYWQSADDVATMIEELYTIMYAPEEATNLNYFYKLEP